MDDGERKFILLFSHSSFAWNLREYLLFEARMIMVPNKELFSPDWVIRKV